LISLNQQFRYIVRLEINDIEFIPEPLSRKLLIKQKPLYIEHDHSLQVLFQNKFLTQQRYELEKSLQ
jgi:hypothetical protein